VDDEEDEDEEANGNGWYGDDGNGKNVRSAVPFGSDVDDNGDPSVWTGLLDDDTMK
jgi:hypothetical protein